MRLVVGKFVFFLALGAGTLLIHAPPVSGQSLAPPFSAHYTLTDLGNPSGVPGLLGGLTLLAGDSNTILVGGNANIASGGIYGIGVTRGAGGHITGFSGSASLFSTAPFIDGGLDYGPTGVLFFTGFPNNTLGEIKPGSSSPDKIVDLSPAGIASSVGSFAFVPSGFPGAGLFKIASYDGGGIYDTTLTADGSGTFDVTSASLQTTLSPVPNPEGIAYVPLGSADFSAPSLLLSEFISGKVGAYQLDAGGNPIPGSRADFVTGLTGAEGAFIDPVTGDFLFSTFGGGNKIVEVRGFSAPPPPSGVPEPATMTLFVVGVLGGFGYRLTRKK